MSETMTDILDAVAEHRAAVHRAEAFRAQASRVQEEAEKLWRIRDWGDASANMNVRSARNTLALLLDEPVPVKQRSAA